MTAAPPASGNIYDLGYRSYDGPRLGRPHAVRALFLHTLRTCFGIGRGGRAKIAPVVLLGLAIIPAVFAVGLFALARQMVGSGDMIEEASPIRHETYYGVVLTFVVLFCAAQAPEALGRDQRHNLLSLYFSRALRRVDYALARFAGIAAAVLLFVLLPQLVMFLGFVLSAEDIGAELGSELVLLPAILGQALILAGLLGGISAAISSFTPRRVFATTAIIVLLAVTPIVSVVLIGLGTTGLAELLVLLSPADILDATNAWLFDTFPESPAVQQADLSPELFAIAAIAITAICLAVIVRRFQTVAA